MLLESNNLSPTFPTRVNKSEGCKWMKFCEGKDGFGRLRGGGQIWKILPRKETLKILRGRSGFLKWMREYRGVS